MEREGGDPIAPESSHEISRTIRSKTNASMIPPPPLTITPSTAANCIAHATPMPPSAVSDNKNNSSPTTTRSLESIAALTALYQSSQRSRHDSPQNVTTYMGTLSEFLPPPPLFRPSASDVIRRQQIVAFPAETPLVRKNANGSIPFGDVDRRYPKNAMPNVPTFSWCSTGISDESPLPTIDIVEQLSSVQVGTRDRPTVQGSYGGIDEDIDPEDPPQKKSKMMAGVSSEPEGNDFATPNTLKSCMSSASFDIFGCPLSRISAISDDILMTPTNNWDLETFLKRRLDATKLDETNAEKDFKTGLNRMTGDEAQQYEGMNSLMSQGDSQVHHHDQTQKQRRGRKKDDLVEKEKRILRRKIERLLLIRHCSTCTFSLPLRVETPCLMPSSPTDQRTSLDVDRDYFSVAEPTQLLPVCPYADCAEGKALCAHIRTCKLAKCSYPRCLTSREVLGHYKKCRDGSCEICAPTRALDREHNEHRKCNSSASSIGTIDDTDWLNANMVKSDRECS